MVWVDRLDKLNFCLTGELTCVNIYSVLRTRTVRCNLPSDQCYHLSKKSTVIMVHRYSTKKFTVCCLEKYFVGIMKYERSICNYNKCVLLQRSKCS